MTQVSGPKSNALFSDDEWQTLNENEAGIVLDYDGTAYALTLPTSSNDATLGSSTQVSAADVAGRAHRIAAGDTQVVTIPDAVGGTQVSIVMLRFDPAWATSDPGPVRVAIVTGAAGAGAPVLDQAYPGVVELPLWQITRAVSQPLSAATVKDLRRRRSVTIHARAIDQLPDSPIGTVAVLPSGSQMSRVVSDGVPAGTVSWARSAPRVSPGSALVAGAGYTSQGWLFQAGTWVGATDGAGYARIAWPQVFPNGILSVQLTNGDDSNPGPGTVSCAGSVWGPAGYGNLSEVVFVARAMDGTPRRSTLVRVNYLALGW